MAMRVFLPWAMIEPPVMLWVMSRRPGFMFNILAGWVYSWVSLNLLLSTTEAL